MLRIALPNKGRLSEEARELFTDAGLEIRAAGPRALTASLGGEFQALFVRAQDIPSSSPMEQRTLGSPGAGPRARVRTRTSTTSRT
jgi:ATP phosphoribosyltransferase